MTIRQTIRDLLGGDEPAPPQDGDDPVEIGIVALAMGPMLVTSLCNAGFDAVGTPTFNIVTDVASDFRILVPRKQAAAASEHLEGIR
jgi:hypothetical protein